MSFLLGGGPVDAAIAPVWEVGREAPFPARCSPSIPSKRARLNRHSFAEL